MTTKTEIALEDMPSWPKVIEAQKAIAVHRVSGDKTALAVAQKALGDAYTACRAERMAARSSTKTKEEPKTEGPPTPNGAPAEPEPDGEPTKVEKPPKPPTTAKTTKKTGGGKKTASSKKKSKTDTK